MKNDYERLFNCQDGPVGPYIKLGDEKIVYQTLSYSAVDEEDARAMFLNDLKALRGTVGGRKKPELFWRSRPEWVNGRLRARLAIPGADFTVIDAHAEGEPIPSFRHLTSADIRMLRVEMSAAMAALERINAILQRR